LFSRPRSARHYFQVRHGPANVPPANWRRRHQPAANPAKGVTDTVISAIDLSQEPANIAGRTLRLRELVVQPGGVVPWHSHGDRPAIIYIVEGSITEYASNCAVPILHKACRDNRLRARDCGVHAPATASSFRSRSLCGRHSPHAGGPKC
jgi:hypothetical protein